MRALRNRLFAGSVSVLTLVAMLVIVVVPADAQSHGDRFADRMVRTLGDTVDVSDAAYRAAKLGARTLDAYLEAFISELDTELSTSSSAESRSAAELLVGYRMSHLQLVHWLRGHLSNELSPALGSRQAFVASTTTSGDTRNRVRIAAPDQERAELPVFRVAAVAFAIDAETHLIACGYRCSSVQPLGP